MAFYVRNPSKDLLNKVSGLIPDDEEMKYIAGIDMSRHRIDFRIGTFYESGKFPVGFVLIQIYESFYKDEGLKEVKESDVTIEMICEALGIEVPAPAPAPTHKQSVLAWGYKDKSTGKLKGFIKPSRSWARYCKLDKEKIVRVRVTEL
jgi:hypothetical protein